MTQKLKGYRLSKKKLTVFENIQRELEPELEDASIIAYMLQKMLGQLSKYWPRSELAGCSRIRTRTRTRTYSNSETESELKFGFAACLHSIVAAKRGSECI